jgi:hypothetical protein
MSYRKSALRCVTYGASLPRRERLSAVDMALCLIAGAELAFLLFIRVTAGVFQ